MLDPQGVFSQLLKSVNERKKPKPSQNGYQIHPHHYFDEEIYLRDLKIIKKFPVLYDRKESFGENTNFRTYDWLTRPLIICQENSGEFYSFSKICRHRAASIVSQECGKASTFSCPYHGWTYNLKGKVVHIPNKDSFLPSEMNSSVQSFGIESCLQGLWVTNDTNETSLKDSLSTLYPELEYASAHYSQLFEYQKEDFAFNWKAPIDAVLEAYHLPFLHTKTFKPIMENGGIGLHKQVSWHSRNLYPFKRLRGVIKAINFKDLYQCSSFVYHIFPNTVFSIQPNFAVYFTIFPKGPHSCTIVTKYLKHPEADEEKLQEGLTLSKKGLKEDFEILADQAYNLKKSEYDTLVFCGQEDMIKNFHENLANIAKFEIGDSLI